MLLSGRRLVLLHTSPRVAPGLLTVQAWDELRNAGTVLCADPPPPLADVVQRAGVPVTPSTDPLRDLLAAAETAPVLWVSDPDADEVELRAGLAAEVVRRSGAGEPPLEVEVCAGSYDLPGAHMIDLVEVMDRLRSDCPWDREQDHRSLARHLLEETYETLEAIETGDRAHLREELGDLLVQVVFHARIADEHPEHPWSIDHVVDEIVAKLVRRHPHVFAGTQVGGVAEVEANWEALKSAEKRRTSLLDGIPMTLPALALADRVLARARPAGIDPPTGDDLGARLLALVAVARSQGLDAEQQLRDAVRRLAAQVKDRERAGRLDAG